MKRGALALAAALSCLIIGGDASAQLSPGPLAAAHAGLEGSGHCLDCHRSGKGVAPELCLDCHTAVGARVAAGRGLHARPGHDACERCHIEHNGRAFALVWWGDAGVRSFDHEQAGHTLAGAHASLECRQCHRPERLRDPSGLRAGGASLDTTFLGLGRACASCHADVHGGTLGDACTSCHGQERWSPATGFDHDGTAWPLRGRHRAQRCEACHASRRSDAAARSSASPAERGATAAVGLFVDDVRGTTCAACHQDPHRGRLGSGCADCHGETSWTAIEEGSFEHGKTRFPLHGRHASVDCGGCHRPDAAAERGEFERCDSCHRDPHLGQFAARSDQGDCQGCHDEQGFAPARFSIADHARTAYPLDGAHLAVPCDGCHVPAHEVAPASSAPAAADATDPRPPIGSRARRYHFPSTACAACHGTPHDEGAAASAACDSCHVTSGWTAVRFDHTTTRFPLEAAHARLECTSCHRPDRAPAASLPPGGLPLGGLPLDCAGCHRDVHGGQLESGGTAAGCDRCHLADHWAPAPRFDHDRDSRFPLVGAHRAAPCAGCHALEMRDGVALTRYRPLSTGCADCHGASSTAARRRP
jgi:hypothetical protein